MTLFHIVDLENFCEIEQDSKRESLLFHFWESRNWNMQEIEEPKFMQRYGATESLEMLFISSLPIILDLVHNSV
jgi:hypothetical protein